MSDALKVHIATFINALMGASVAFHLVLTEVQMGAVMLVVNAGLSLFAVATIKSKSP